MLRRAAALDAGFIDTAESYNAEGDEPGGAERIVADEIEGIRDQIFLASKLSPRNFRYDDVLAHAAASSERLRAEVIDLYQLHAPNPGVPIAETMRAMERLVADGAIRHIGVSNFSVDEMKAAQDALTTHPLVSNQVHYNVFDRSPEAEVLPYCQEQGITLIAHTPLGMGTFATRPGAEVLARVADETSKTQVQVMLNWLVSQPAVMAIPKTDRVERVDELVGSVGWELSSEQRRSLEALG